MGMVHKSYQKSKKNGSENVQASYQCFKKKYRARYQGCKKKVQASCHDFQNSNWYCQGSYFW